MLGRLLSIALVFLVACGGQTSTDGEDRDLALAVTLAKRVGDDSAFDAVLLAVDRGYTYEQVATGIDEDSLGLNGMVAGADPAGSPAYVFTGHPGEAGVRFVLAWHVEDDHQQLRADAVEWGATNAGPRAAGRSQPVAATTTLLYVLRSGFTGVQIMEAIAALAPLQRTEPCPGLEIGGGVMHPRGCE